MIYELRSINHPRDLEALEDVQRKSWGYEDLEITPGSLMVASLCSGGIVVAAYPQGSTQPVGFAFSFAAFRSGQAWQHSHLLAIVPEHRGTGLARELKLRQREQAIALGFDRMTWTFDPLVARNARLNLGKLGARAISYHADWYSTRGVYAGIPADRLMVEWIFRQESINQKPSIVDGPRVLEKLDVAFGPPGNLKLEPTATHVFIELPSDIDQLKRNALDVARDWREAHRQAFGHYLRCGFTVTDLAVDGERIFYKLEC